MSISRRCLAVLAGAAVMTIGVPAARADVMYATTMIMGDGTSQQGKSTPGMTMTTYDKGTSERKVMSMQMGPMSWNSITIENCGTDEMITLDPTDKLYSVDPIGGFSVAPAAPSMTSMYRPQQQHQQQPVQTGTSDVTFNAQDLGIEKIGDLTTQHAMFTIHTVTTGCAGDNDTTEKIEIWTAPIPTYDCPTRFQPTAREENSPGSSRGGCKVTYQVHGDFLAMRKAMSGMIVQMKLYNGGKFEAMQKLVNYSSAPLDPSLFQVPDDYRKVSDQEMEQAQDQDRMHSMGVPAGAGQPPAGNGGNGGNDNPQDNGNNNDNGQNNNGDDNGDQNNGDNQTPPPPKKKNPLSGIHLPF